MYAGEPVSNELFGDMRESIALTLRPLLSGKYCFLPNLVENIACCVSDSPGELAIRVPVVRASRRVRCRLRNPCELECLGVVEGRVSPAMMYGHGEISRYLVEVAEIQRPFVFDLGVV